jgi:hypothetical protein
VEFHLGPDEEVDELFFHQPNGTFVARRATIDPRGLIAVPTETQISSK